MIASADAQNARGRCMPALTAAASNAGRCRAKLRGVLVVENSVAQQLNRPLRMMAYRPVIRSERPILRRAVVP